MTTWTVTFPIPDGSYDESDIFFGLVVPHGNWTVLQVRYYCDTVSSDFVWLDAGIHSQSTNWFDSPTPTRIGSDTGFSMEAGTYFWQGEAYSVGPITNQPYSAAHEVAAGRWGVVLVQVHGTTGVVSTKVSSSPQTHLDLPGAVAALPPPDAGHVSLAYQIAGSGDTPWTANTSPALSARARLSKRDDGSGVFGMLQNYDFFADGIERNDPCAGPPYDTGVEAELVAVSLYITEDATVFSGGYIALDLENDLVEGGHAARGEARGAAILTGPASAALFDASALGRAHTAVVVPGVGLVAPTARGDGRARVPVRDAKATDGIARLDALTSEVLYTPDDLGATRTTKLDHNLLGRGPIDETRATHLNVQQAGAANPEGLASHTTHLNVQQAGAANPQASAARVTFLSVLQVLRVPGGGETPGPGPPQRVTRPGGCTMYNVIRAGEEESGVDASQGTYKRLSDEIFLYRRELLQRLRMSYFDAEDITVTLNIPQGLP
jgi:hypothetical protein